MGTWTTSRKRLCLQAAPESAVYHDLSDVVKVVDEYHDELVKK